MEMLYVAIVTENRPRYQSIKNKIKSLHKYYSHMLHKKKSLKHLARLPPLETFIYRTIIEAFPSNTFSVQYQTNRRIEWTSVVHHHSENSPTREYFYSI